ncbi:hypothetical protein GCM10009817_18050 [Terrabacter lapilli]|uniref:Uncharacterized protein n=1 Tax=Terrabacter lapilli TaxID=436231 RepID=A0ABN2RZZ9_9MICO
MQSPALRRRQVCDYFHTRDVGQIVHCLEVDAPGGEVFNGANVDMSVAATSCQTQGRG